MQSRPTYGSGVAALRDDWRDFFKEQINRIGADAQPAPHSWLDRLSPFSQREKVRERENVASFDLVLEDGRPLPP